MHRMNWFALNWTCGNLVQKVGDPIVWFPVVFGSFVTYQGEILHPWGDPSIAHGIARE